MKIKKLFFADEFENSISKKVLVINYILVLGIVFGVFVYSFLGLEHTLKWDSIWKYRMLLVNGFFTTLTISFLSLVFSILLGTVFGVTQKSRFIPLRVFSKIYIELIRGTPLLVQILIFFYVVANAIGINDRYVAGVIIMSVFAGAYIAEIIRSGIDNVAKSQLETAKAIGLTKSQTYLYVIFPQVVTKVMPPLAGQFASLVKDSSLLSIIAIKEFTMAAREINANTFSTFESYIPLAIGYLLMTIPISIITKRLERRYKYES